MKMSMLVLMSILHVSKWVYGYINDVVNVSIAC
jgi:hypothetical protein